MDKCRSFLVAFLILLSSFLVAPEAGSRTWYVTPGGSGDAPDIQAAIDSCSTGDTVLVAPGTYPIDTDIYCNDKGVIHILGEGGALQTVLDAGGLYVRFIVQCYSGEDDEVVLRGFTFQYFGEDAVIIGFACGRVVLEENIIRFNGEAAIDVVGVDELMIRNNLVYSNGWGIASAFCHDVSILGNTVSYNEKSGILLEVGTMSFYDLSNNLITNNYYGVTSYSSQVTLTCNNAHGNFLNYNPFGIDDPTGSDGNIAVNPQYCALNPRNNGNFFLQSDSPCAPGNHPTGYPCGLIGWYPVGCSSTAVAKTSWGALKSMYR